jgi:Ca2+-binding EF-hand superfamily protein
MSRFAFLLLVVAAPTAFAQASPPTDDEAISAMFARMDSDRDGQLSQGEFEKGTRAPYGSAREGVVYQRLPAHFRALDVDADGYLSAGEYAGLAARWQGAGPAPAFADADRSGDARIDFREFAALHAPVDTGARGNAATN